MTGSFHCRSTPPQGQHWKCTAQTSRYLAENSGKTWNCKHKRAEWRTSNAEINRLREELGLHQLVLETRSAEIGELRRERGNLEESLREHRAEFNLQRRNRSSPLRAAFGGIFGLIRSAPVPARPARMRLELVGKEASSTAFPVGKADELHGCLDLPEPNAAAIAERVAVAGRAFHTTEPLLGVVVLVDGIVAATTATGIERADVSAAYPGHAQGRTSGWSTTIDLREERLSTVRFEAGALFRDESIRVFDQRTICLSWSW
jgi:hypothetical protein